MHLAYNHVSLMRLKVVSEVLDGKKMPSTEPMHASAPCLSSDPTA